MRRLTLALLPALLHVALACTAPAHALDKPGLDRTLAAIQADPMHPLSGLVVVAVKDGRIVYEGAFGQAVLDPGRERPLTVDTRVRVASLSKVPMALAAMDLAEAGRLDLDRDVGDYLGFPLRNPAFPDRPITARMLLTHTSSIRDGEIYGLPVQHALSDFFDPASPYWEGGAHWSAGHPPGAFFTYSNLGIGVLATVIERIEGKRFDRVVAERVLAPLGIRAAWDVRTLSDADFQVLAPVHRLEEGRWKPQVDDHQGRRPDGMVSPFGVTATAPLSAYVVGRNATTLSPQGGLRASAAEVATLLRLLLGKGAVDGKGILEPASVQAMLTEAWTHDPNAHGGRGNGETERGFYTGWGLGLQYRIPIPGTSGRFCGHLAEAYGLLGGMILDPQRGIGWVYLLTGTSAEPKDYPVPGSGLSRWEVEVSRAVWEQLTAAP
ncbi:MAG TPA: serine hydrolase domain-containing protein [Azospirillaceae bacterium]|nr:serine hydrolase domain-containing protein [Azospirillaceae bacterium]